MRSAGLPYTVTVYINGRDSEPAVVKLVITNSISSELATRRPAFSYRIG